MKEKIRITTKRRMFPKVMDTLLKKSDRPQFPKIRETPKLFYRSGNYTVAFVETNEMVKFYYWDNFSLSYNILETFEKL
jgi:hypothetical protein